MRRSILSSLRAHLGRLVAACLAIVLGVGFGTLAMTAHSSATNGIDQTIGKQNAGVDAVFTSNNDSVTAADVAAGQEVAAGRFGRRRHLGVHAGPVGRPGPARHRSPSPPATTPRKIAGPTTKTGKLPEAKNEIALPARLADKHKVALGQQLKLTLVRRQEPTR